MFKERKKSDRELETMRKKFPIFSSGAGLPDFLMQCTKTGKMYPNASNYTKW
jgi:hypothetical protein